MTELKSMVIPDIGDVGDVEVIETMMQVGHQVVSGQALITVESDKASMDIPCSESGVIREVTVQVGDKVKQGDLMARVEVAETVLAQISGVIQSDNPLDKRVKNEPSTTSKPIDTSVQKQTPTIAEQALIAVAPNSAIKVVQAGPASRRLARKLGVDIVKIAGTGRRGRILKEDVQAHVKTILQNQSTDAFATAVSVLPDVSKFGATHAEKLSKVEQLTSRNMQRAWREIPHAWLQQAIDITELDQGRKRLKNELEGLTVTTLIVKAISLSLAQFPRFNCVLDVQAQQLIYRDYINIGVAVDTPRGLIIAVIRDVDRLSIGTIGRELNRLSALARAGELPASDMQGASMTVSSLGSLGIDGLQPIVNWPEVAIIGVARANVQAIYTGSQFEPRLMLPVTLGFDHRVINGADGAKFLTYVKQLLIDPMRLLVMS